MSGVRVAAISTLNVGLWCVRRAVAFAAISMGCQDLSNHKVHFKRKSPFQNGRPRSGLSTGLFQRDRPCPTARSVPRPIVLLGSFEKLIAAWRKPAYPRPSPDAYPAPAACHRRERERDAAARDPHYSPYNLPAGGAMTYGPLRQNSSKLDPWR